MALVLILIFRVPDSIIAQHEMSGCCKTCTGCLEACPNFGPLKKFQRPKKKLGNSIISCIVKFFSTIDVGMVAKN